MNVRPARTFCRTALARYFSKHLPTQQKHVFPSQQPALFEILFGGGVVTALGKGIAAQNPPRAEQYSDDRPVIVDAFQRILRTGGTIQAGML